MKDRASAKFYDSTGQIARETGMKKKVTEKENDITETRISLSTGNFGIQTIVIERGLQKSRQEG